MPLSRSVTKAGSYTVITVVVPNEPAATAVLKYLDAFSPDAFQPMPHDKAAALLRDQPETVRLPRANFPPFVDEDGVASACPNGQCGVD